ncbi:winged helix DNA-binding protein [Sphingomonas sp. dw_22]|uniref:winged helix DNA-binding protein n=1 Tax=Sphingomonas sp. dw_22 TaxID=2721175 RepID=UPI001BD5C72D|nr:winged helix DNA-binding protein [Sphingomonas sp. dw_22]
MTNFITSPQGAVPSYAMSMPQALVIAESSHAGDATLEALELAGFRARARLSFADAARDLSSYDGIDLIVIEAAGVPEAMLDVVLARADTVAIERSLGVVAMILPEQIDAAASQLTGPRVQFLCDPSASERASAFAFLRWKERGALNDAARDTESLRLQRLNEEVARIADTLARLTRGEEGERRAGVRDSGLSYRGPEDAKGFEPSAQEIRAVIRSRRLRGQFFSGELFADPAWDMLLDLFAAQLEHRQVSVSSLCIAAAVPPTTALRWIGTLHEAGLFERHADPSDRRRAYIALSEKALEGMRSYAGAAKRAGLSLV